MLNELREQIDDYANERKRLETLKRSGIYEKDALKRMEERLFADTENIMRNEFPGLNRLLPKGLKGEYLYNAGYFCFNLYHSEEKGLVVYLTTKMPPANKFDNYSKKIRRRLNEIEKTHGFTIDADTF
tara:strand:+ start:3237 stop:3620 length:384 start_codon:yes stop_codon:yes gene_type:complete